jgi:hypothetical protein
MSVLIYGLQDYKYFRHFILIFYIHFLTELAILFKLFLLSQSKIFPIILRDIICLQNRVHRHRAKPIPKKVPKYHNQGDLNIPIQKTTPDSSKWTDQKFISLF